MGSPNAMFVWAACAALCAAAFEVSAQAQSVSIEHKPIACVVADRFPVVEARVEPADKVGRARVLFRAAGTPDWYFVEMKREKGVFHGTLPKPLKATKKIEYYIDAVDRSLEERRTAEHAPAVVGGAGECPSKMLTAAVLASAKMAVGSLAPGVTALPAGFSSVGILGGSVAGTAAGAGASSGAAAGGGALKTVLIVGGVAVAGGTALAASGRLGSDDKKLTFWDITFVPSFNVRACPNGVSFGGGAFSSDAGGNFDFRLPNMSQDIMRLSGQVSDTSLSGNVTCLVGGATASLNASGSGGQFQGTFTLNGATVSYTVTKK